MCPCDVPSSCAVCSRPSLLLRELGDCVKLLFGEVLPSSESFVTDYLTKENVCVPCGDLCVICVFVPLIFLLCELSDCFIACLVVRILRYHRVCPARGNVRAPVMSLALVLFYLPRVLSVVIFLHCELGNLKGRPTNISPFILMCLSYLAEPV